MESKKIKGNPTAISDLFFASIDPAPVPRNKSSKCLNEHFKMAYSAKDLPPRLLQRPPQRPTTVVSSPRQENFGSMEAAITKENLPSQPQISGTIPIPPKGTLGSSVPIVEESKIPRCSKFSGPGQSSATTRLPVRNGLIQTVTSTRKIGHTRLYQHKKKAISAEHLEQNRRKASPTIHSQTPFAVKKTDGHSLNTPKHKPFPPKNHPPGPIPIKKLLPQPPAPPQTPPFAGDLRKLYNFPPVSFSTYFPTLLRITRASLSALKTTHQNTVVAQNPCPPGPRRRHQIPQHSHLARKSNALSPAKARLRTQHNIQHDTKYARNTGSSPRTQMVERRPRAENYR
jgi:hypothetical protein